jgi:hypothetical protein
MFDDDPPTRLPVTPIDGTTPPHQHLAPTDDTRLFQAPDRRTPRPQPISRDPSTANAATRAKRAPSAPLDPRSTSSRPGPPTPAPLTPVVPAVLLAPTLPGGPAPSAPKQAPVYPRWDSPVTEQPSQRDMTALANENQGLPLHRPRPLPGSVPPPQVAGFAKPAPTSGVQPWMLIVGAVLVAILAFAITRAFIG